MQKALSNPVIMYGIETRVPNADQTILKSPGRVLPVCIMIHAEIFNKKWKIKKKLFDMEYMGKTQNIRKENGWSM